MTHLSGSFTGVGTAPALLNATAPVSNQIVVQFSEVMDPATLIVANFTLTANGGSTPRTITSATPLPAVSPTSVVLGTSGPMDVGTAKYTVAALPAVHDAAANAIDPALDDHTVDVPGTPLATDVSSEG